VVWKGLCLDANDFEHGNAASLWPASLPISRKGHWKRGYYQISKPLVISHHSAHLNRVDNENAVPPAKPNRKPNRKVQLVEVSVFLFLILPALVLSFLTGSEINSRFAQVAITSVLNDLALLSLVLYFLWRNGESVREIGWNFDNLRPDIAWGLILFIPIVFGGNLLEAALHKAGLSAPSRLPPFVPTSGFIKLILGFVIVTVVAVVEETIFRGYLMLRFMAVTGRASTAVILSSIVFSLGHGYEGLAGTVTVFVLGVVLALVYLWRNSLVTSIIIHFLTDFSSIVLPALLQSQ
jgi:CAAX protease family protein